MVEPGGAQRCRGGRDEMTDTVRFPDEVRASFTGELIGPGEAGYEQARGVHNGLIDRRPALIARCRTIPDIQDAVIIGRTTSWWPWSPATAAIPRARRPT